MSLKSCAPVSLKTFADSSCIVSPHTTDQGRAHVAEHLEKLRVEAQEGPLKPFAFEVM